MTQLAKRMAAVDGVDVGESAFGEHHAFWVNAKEMAHACGWGLSLRPGKVLIREHRPGLKADPRVDLRRSGGDWMEIRVVTRADAAFALEWFERAVDVYRAAPGALPRPPPTGADLVRRRRWH